MNAVKNAVDAVLTALADAVTHLTDAEYEDVLADVLDEVEARYDALDDEDDYDFPEPEDDA